LLPQDPRTGCSEEADLTAADVAAGNVAVNDPQDGTKDLAAVKT
jgi:hypothetical protein|tara:strand:+ start:184 stop:315 length:132 start_codon:yes stop_codon:yes gene_type:complete